MKIHLLYGKRGIDFNIDEKNIYKIIRKKPMPIVEDPETAIIYALSSPIGTPPLRKVAQGKKNAVIVVSDITRPVPNKIILPPLLSELQRTGIKREDITILIATGIHRPNEGDELIELLGEEIVKSYKIVNHDAMNMKEMEYVGKSGDIDVYINKTFLEKDLKIITGLIEPHFMAGFSGGRKSILPGISSFETVKYYHSPYVLESPYAKNLTLDNNPFHEGATKIAKLSNVDFILNVVIDESRNIGGIFAGDLEEAYQKGVEFAERYSKVEVKDKVDVIITTSAGYPLDKTYYQTVKGLVGVLEIIKSNGIIIIASECSEGLGSQYFQKVLRELKTIKNYDKFIERLYDTKRYIPDQWEVEELVKVLKVTEQIYMYSSLSPKDYELTFTNKISTIEEGIEMAKKRYGDSVKIAIIPEGPYVIPVLEGENNG